jgi:hypothetical protein
MKSKRSLAVAAASVVIAFIASGCMSIHPGAAAVVGDDRISESQLTQQVQRVLRAQGRPVDTPSEALVVTTLDRMITTSLVEQFADREGITVNQGELDATLANFTEASGGKEAFEELLIQQDLAPEDIDSLFRVNILAQKLGLALDPTGSPESQSAAIFAAIAAFSDEIGTQVSPRYGSWQGAGLQIGPALNDLSTPVGVG